MARTYIRALYFCLWSAFIFTALILFTRSSPPSKDPKVLNIFTWGDVIHPDTISAFEKETGIRVQLNFYDSNEELITKLIASKGEGYDLLIPSDYATKILANHGLLRPLDKKRCPFFSSIHPALFSHHFDPENTYSIPFVWEVYGLGIDRLALGKKEISPSYKQLFDPHLNYKLSMTPDPVEAIALVSHYLFGKVDSLDDTQVFQVKEVLRKQKRNVEAYADYRARYLLATHNCPVTLLTTGHVFESKRLSEDIDFLLPKEGLFTTIESLCIPASTNKLDMVYAFLNFVFQPEVMANQVALRPAYPSSMNALPFTDQEPYYYSTLDEILSRKEDMVFFKYLIPEEEILDLWIELKASN